MGRTVREGRCCCDIEYAALPSQARFHTLNTRFKGFSGPIGSGKSRALCHEAVRLSYINSGRFGLLGAPTYPMLRDATQASLLEILDDNGIPYELRKSENILLMKDTHSKILFRSVEDFERLRGTNLAWFGLDELSYTPEEAWLRLEGRLRDPGASKLCGFAVWTPKGHDWVYRKFLEDTVNGYETVIAKPMENRFILDSIPDFYERLKYSYDEKFYRQEVLGEYLNIHEGRVYHAFQKKVHVREPVVDPALPLLWALDFNVDPMSSLVAQVSGETVQVLDEIVLSRASTREACEEFINRFPNHRAGLQVYGDASGSHRQTSGTTDWAIIKEFLNRNNYPKAGYCFPKANPPIRERVALVNAMFKCAAGDERLFVHRRCKETIKDFEEVSYKPNSSVIDKDRDSRRTHLSDALGYLLWRKFGPKAPVGEQRNPIV